MFLRPAIKSSGYESSHKVVTLQIVCVMVHTQQYSSTGNKSRSSDIARLNFENCPIYSALWLDIDNFMTTDRNCGKKNKSKCCLNRGLCSYRQRVRFIILFPNFFFSYCFCILMQRILKGKSDAYKKLICMMQSVHFQIRVVDFSCQDKDLFRYVWYCGKKQIECG